MLSFPFLLPMTGDFWYCCLFWTIVQCFIFHVQNITFFENCTKENLFIFYNLKAWKTIQKYRVVLSAIWLYWIKVLWQAIPNFWTVVYLYINI